MKGKFVRSISYFLLLALLTFIIFTQNSDAFADTGWVVPSVNVGGSGVTNPQNAYALDTSYARFAANGNYWNWYSYDLSSIPAGSTINGIEVNARGLRQSGCGTNCLMRVRLSYDGGTTWTNYLNTVPWTNTKTDHIVGGPTNTWGRSWTRDEIVNSFRVQTLWQITGTTYYGDLDYLPVRINYTSPTYNISGYVTNKSSGLALNVVSVTTKTSLSTTTNSTGYYNFNGLSIGTYLINASLSGYFVNSTTVTISGADITNANISLLQLTYSLNITYTFTETNPNSTWQSISIKDNSYGDALTNVSIFNVTSGRLESILNNSNPFTGGTTPSEHVNVSIGASGNASSYDAGGGQIKIRYNWTNSTLNNNLGIDLINVTVFYKPIYLLNITTNTTNVPESNRSELQLKYMFLEIILQSR